MGSTAPQTETGTSGTPDQSILNGGSAFLGGYTPAEEAGIGMLGASRGILQNQEQATQGEATPALAQPTSQTISDVLSGKGGGTGTSGVPATTPSSGAGRFLDQSTPLPAANTSTKEISPTPSVEIFKPTPQPIVTPSPTAPLQGPPGMNPGPIAQAAEADRIEKARVAALEQARLASGMPRGALTPAQQAYVDYYKRTGAGNPDWSRFQENAWAPYGAGNYDAGG